MAQMRVPLFRPSLSWREAQAVADVLSSGHLTTGPRCAEFEARFARRLGAAHAVSTSSCSAALHLSLAALDVGPGDIVFVPALAFAADVQAPLWQGATPIPVDCDAETLCISPARLRDTIERLEAEGSTRPTTRETFRAVLAIDYAGQMADYDALRPICRQRGMVLIEDAAHALPASWRTGAEEPWRMPPAGDLACFSFYANKPITTGEGGMVVTHSEAWARKIRAMRNHGFASAPGTADPAPWNRQVVMQGFKYNLSDIAAAIGLCQLERLEEFWQARRQIAAGYGSRLGDCPFLKLPQELPNRRHAWHLYVVRLLGVPSADTRNRIVRRLHQRGVETSIHWYPPHLQEYFRGRLRLPLPLPVAEAAYASMLSLPIFPAMTTEELDYVAAHLREAVEQEASQAEQPREARL